MNVEEPVPGPVSEFAQNLKEWKQRHGNPSYRGMASHSRYSHTTLSKVDKGVDTLPRSDHLEEYVCSVLKHEDAIGEEIAKETNYWKSRLREAEAEAAISGDGDEPAHDFIHLPIEGIGTDSSLNEYEIPHQSGEAEHTPVRENRESAVRRAERKGTGTAVACASLLTSVVIAIIVATLATFGVFTKHISGTALPAMHSALNPLLLFWNGTTGDNLTITEARWRAEKDSLVGYEQQKVLGFVWPHDSRSSNCTIPLVHYQSPRINGKGVDHVTTTDPNQAASAATVTSSDGVKPSTVIGLVYRPDLPQPPGTEPLYRLYSKQRQDFLTTSDKKWTDREYAEIKKGYSHIRLEGYVVKSGAQAPVCT